MEHTGLQALLLGRGGLLAEPDALRVQCMLRTQLSPSIKLEEQCTHALLKSTGENAQSRGQLFEKAVNMAKLPLGVTYAPTEGLNNAFQELYQPSTCKELLLHAAAARNASTRVSHELNMFLMRREEERLKAEQQLHEAALQLAAAQEQLLQQQQQRQQHVKLAPLEPTQRPPFEPGSRAKDSKRILPAKRPLPQDNHRQHHTAVAHQQEEPPPKQPPKPGFQTALQKLGTDQAKKGQANESIFGMTGQPRMQGLGRPVKRGGLSQAGGLSRGGLAPQSAKPAEGNKQSDSLFSEKVLAMLGGPNGQVPPEIEKLDPKIVEMVCNEILDSGSSTSWADIAGLENAKKLVHEIIVWPMQNPQLFKGARAPPKGLLLFGPPGTGKTLIGRAIASNINATFFSISASSLTSKWIGDGEKMVRALFAVANCFASSVIFIDEIDSILSARKTEGEHEASRRMKTEMLVQMEGCNPSGERRVLLVGATNRPDELDEAARRRMPKQLYIPLPCAEARRQMILHQLRDVKCDLPPADLEKVVAKTDGYSGSDMRNFIQEACQAPVRDAISRHGSAVQNLVEGDLRPIRLRDFQLASKAQKASVTTEEVQRYLDYDARHGAKYVEAVNDVESDEEIW